MKQAVPVPLTKDDIVIIMRQVILPMIVLLHDASSPTRYSEQLFCFLSGSRFLSGSSGCGDRSCGGSSSGFEALKKGLRFHFNFNFNNVTNKFGIISRSSTKICNHSKTEACT
jgi:hypothetical protein